MKNDQIALQRAQRNAYEFMARPVITLPNNQKVPNPFKVSETNITEPAILIQEQAFVNTQNAFSFDFSQTAPPKTTVLNNVLLGTNNIFVIYGIQLLLGEGANGNNRVYRPFGVTQNDESIYNSTMSLTVEQSNLIASMDGLQFKDFDNSPLNMWNTAGMVLINPQRVLTGRLGVFLFNITLLNSIAGLALTANTFLSVRLHGALGQAAGVPGR